MRGTGTGGEGFTRKRLLFHITTCNYAARPLGGVPRRRAGRGVSREVCPSGGSHLPHGLSE